MPDIELRFDKDMLVLSAPIDAVLARQGIDSARDRQYLNLMEPDVVQDALNLEMVAGAQCLVTTTEDITRARLAHVRMDDDAERLAREALAIANDATPQHILVEIGPTGLPLNSSSKASLNENRAQYADAARLFGNEGFDAFFLNGFTSISDMKCALMGVAQVSDKPVFASMAIGEAALEPVTVPSDGSSTDADAADQSASHAFSFYEPVEVSTFTGARKPRTPLPIEQWPEAVAAMEDLGADVIGFETADSIPKAVEYAQQTARLTGLPLLAQLYVDPTLQGKKTSPLVPLADIEEYTPDTMGPVAVKLYGAGVQFLRATGAATPAFTGALAATVAGLDVHRN